MRDNCAMIIYLVEGWSLFISPSSASCYFNGSLGIRFGALVSYIVFGIG